MKCPRCQQDNPPRAKFCLECAAPLALRCASCGTQLPSGAKFCFECATPVSGPDSTSRLVTLYRDLDMRLWLERVGAEMPN
jgi:Double zinc ribbon